MARSSPRQSQSLASLEVLGLRCGVDGNASTVCRRRRLRRLWATIVPAAAVTYGKPAVRQAGSGNPVESVSIFSASELSWHRRHDKCIDQMQLMNHVLLRQNSQIELSHERPSFRRAGVGQFGAVEMIILERASKSDQQFSGLSMVGRRRLD